MQVFYKDGFYIKGVSLNIPVDAIEITEETYKTLLREMGNGKTIVTNEHGYPEAKDNYDLIKEKELKEVEKEFEEIVNTPIEYKGYKYLPKHTNVYASMLPRFFDETVTLEIWDAEDKEAKTFGKFELIDLIKVLSEVYENAYQTKKAKEAIIKGM